MATQTNNVSTARPTAHASHTSKPSMGSFTGAIAQLQQTGSVRAFPAAGSASSSPVDIARYNFAARTGQA